MVMMKSVKLKMKTGWKWKLDRRQVLRWLSRQEWTLRNSKNRLFCTFLSWLHIWF